MKNTSKYAVTFIVSLYASSLSAAPPANWLIKDVYIVEVSVFEHNTTEVLRVKFADADPAALAEIGCPPTTTHQVAAHWYSGGYSVHQTALMSALWAAQAQGARVDLFINPERGCDQNVFHQNVSNDTAPGLGIWLDGINIK